MNVKKIKNKENKKEKCDNKENNYDKENMLKGLWEISLNQ